MLQNWLQNGQKVQEIQIFSKSLDKNLDYLEKAWLSRFISIVLICLDDLDKNLDTCQSRLKSLDFKNLDQEKKVDLDVMDNLDGFQKLVSTRWTFSILISIGLERRDPQGYFLPFQELSLFRDSQCRLCLRYVSRF